MNPAGIPGAPLHATEIVTPVGPLAVFVTPEDGVIRLSGIGSILELSRSLPSGLSVRGWEERTIPPVRAAVQAWIEGERDAHARVPVSQVGGAFMQRVWLAMRGIPAGEVVTYGELAVLAGNPRAARAAGHACARNVVGIFVPCHRVVSTTGLGGYGLGGNDLKRRLLQYEGVDVDRLGLG